jgi:hypothetical protein
MSDNIKEFISKEKRAHEPKVYPVAGHMEELGSATAEAICASMVAANDDAPRFGPTILGSTLTHTSKELNPDVLANALAELRAHAFPAPFFKGKFMQNYRVILGKTDEK